MGLEERRKRLQSSLKSRKPTTKSTKIKIFSTRYHINTGTNDGIIKKLFSKACVKVKIEEPHH